LTGRVAWQIGAQRGLERALWIGGLGLVVAAIGLFLVQHLWLTPSVVTPTLVVCGLAAVCAFASGFWRRPRPIALAARIDVANDLHSDLSNALALSSMSGLNAPMADLAVARGVASAKTADWRRAAPWRGAVSGSAGIVAAAGTILFFGVALWAPAIGGHHTARALTALPDPGRPEEPEGLALGAATVEALEDLRPEPPAPDEDTTDVTQLDERVRGAVDALDALVQAVLDGQLSQEEAFSRLSELEGDLASWQDEVGGGIAEAQARVADAAKTRLEDTRQASEALKDMLEALRKRSWNEAAEAAEAAAKKLMDGSLNKREQEKLAKSLEKLATDLKSEHAKKKEALREDEDRLKAKEKLAPEKMTPKEKERLKELERELESLEREEKEVSEAMRELAKLAREYEDLARELMKRFKLKGGSGDSGESGGQGANKKTGEGGKGEGGSEGGGGPEDSLRRAAEMIRKLGAGEASSEEASKALDRIERMRDALKQDDKASQDVGQGQPLGGKPQGGDEGQSAQGMQGSSGADGQEGGSKAGESGQESSSMAMNESSEAGANGGEMPGEKGQGSQAVAGKGEDGSKGQGQSGAPGEMSMSQGDSSAQKSELTMQGQGEGGKKSGESAQIGDEGDSEGASLGNGKAPGQGQPKVGTAGIGSGHDANLLGDKTDANGKGKAEFVAGAQGEGQSTSNIVEVAAQRGFATAGYEEVLQDYRDVAEDALKRELIPAGKRGYVRRYFDLIKPR